MRSRTLVLRYVGGDSLAQTGIGGTAGSVTFTASRHILIRGWKFSGYIWLGPAAGAVSSFARACFNITRATVRNTSFMLDRANACISALTNAAGTENVGACGQSVFECKRYLSREEAEDLGLLLDYGESIRALYEIEVMYGGNGNLGVQGFFLYEEID